MNVVGYVVEHDVTNEKGEPRTLEYRLDEGASWKASWWSYRVKGQGDDMWRPVWLASIRAKLDRGLHPRTNTNE